MNKQVTPGTNGGQGEHGRGQFDEASSEGTQSESAHGSEQSENIRSFAEHIVRELCARHNPSQNKSQ